MGSGKLNEPVGSRIGTLFLRMCAFKIGHLCLYKNGLLIIFKMQYIDESQVVLFYDIGLYLILLFA